MRSGEQEQSYSGMSEGVNAGEAHAPGSSPPVPLVPKVLVVDDERKLAELVKGYLLAEGLEVLVAYDGITALEMAGAERPDVVVLDVMLPGLDGVEVCRRLRQFSDAYVLMLTARSEEIDKIIGLAVGADDYLTKPFSPRELVARVKAMLRRVQSPRAGFTGAGGTPVAIGDGGRSGRPPVAGVAPGTGGASGLPDLPPPLVFGELTIDEGRHEVIKGGQPVHLTPREFGLLAMLASQPGRVFTRDQLLRRVWGDEYYGDHVVDVRVTHLRKKLDDDPAEPRYIETVRGVGYRFMASTPSSSPSPSPSPSPPSGPNPGPGVDAGRGPGSQP